MAVVNAQNPSMSVIDFSPTVLREAHNCWREPETRISRSVFECLFAESGSVAGHCVCARLSGEGFLRGGSSGISLPVSAALPTDLSDLPPLPQGTATTDAPVT